jgi:hypothetical protein
MIELAAVVGLRNAAVSGIHDQSKGMANVRKGQFRMWEHSADQGPRRHHCIAGCKMMHPYSGGEAALFGK